MASLVVLERHLWLTLTEIKDADRVSFLDAPISPSGLFGPAVKGFAERFTEAQKASQAMRHFLPKRSSPAAAQSRPRTAPTQQSAKPAPAVYAPQPARTQQPRGRSRSARRHPPPTPGPPTQDSVGPCAPGVLLICRTGRGSSPATAGPPTKRPLMGNLLAPRSFPGAEGIVSVATGSVQATMQLSAVIAEK